MPITKTKTILAFLFLVFHAAGARAELYKWTDSAGREYYVDDLAKVPPEYRARAGSLNPSAPQFNVQSRPTGNDNAEVRRQTYTGGSGKNEAQWRSRADSLRAQIRQRREDLDHIYGLKKDCVESQKYVISSRNRDCERSYSDSIKRMEEEIEALRSKLENDLPEEARRAGASPGWLRETNASVDQANSGSRDETWWRDQAATVREQLRNEQGRLDRYNEQERACEEEQRYNTGCKKQNCKVMYADQKKNSQRQIEKLRQKLEVELPEEARRAGAYAGWLRE